MEHRITLYCPVCGNDQFSCLDTNIVNMVDAPDNTQFQCADCKKIITKAELIENNQDIINAKIQEIKQQAINRIEKKIKEVFK